MPNPMTSWRAGGLVFLAALLGAAAPAPLAAQCPDGTTPPCRRAAAAGARRPNPPLDERTWIVVPFENVTRAPEMDWLREASVNLLYLDMSRWSDIRVIDDERVADLVRELSEVRAGGQLSLQAGIAAARRAGAGRLVMGDVLMIGRRTRVVAKIFDVRSGQRLRNAVQETDAPDSLLALFGRLARGILGADPPGGAGLGIGTTRLDAYQEYLAGVVALNTFDVDEAYRRFERALELDTAFALAHYKLSIVVGWVGPGDPRLRQHADAAARLAGGLPRRERTLIAAQAQGAAGEYWRACETLAPLVREDSTDVESLYAMGECLWHDAGVVPHPGDSTRFLFRASVNASLRLFRMVLESDPTYHLAYQHILDAYQATFRTGCLVVAGRPDCERDDHAFIAVQSRAGDTLVQEPVLQITGAGAITAQLAQAHRDGSRRRNREDARREAEQWVIAGPTEGRARMAYARALLRVGDIEQAAVAASQAGVQRTSTAEQGQFALDRIEIALKRDDPEEAYRIYDSMRALLDTVPGAEILIGAAAAVLGRPSRMDTAITLVFAGPRWGLDYFTSQVRAVMGVTDDSLEEREREFVTRLAAIQGSPGGADVVTASLVYAPWSRGQGGWPASDTGSGDGRIRLVSWLAAGDTIRFRTELAAFDSLLAAQTPEEPDQGWAIVSAEAHLLLGDTAGALARLRRFTATTWRVTPLTGTVGPGFGQTGMLWPRAFLLLGDLEAASGRSAAAAAAYGRFIGMWQNGDAEVQPVVARARRALEALGQ